MNYEDIFSRSAQPFEKYRGNYFYKTWPFSNETYGYILSNNSNGYKIVEYNEECPFSHENECGKLDSF